MTDNRWIGHPDVCTVCGRLGEPHAWWCVDMRERLRGADLHAHKLSLQDCDRIRARSSLGERQTDLAKEYGVSIWWVNAIANGRARVSR